MKRVPVEGADPAVREFLRNLAIDPDGVELELNGQVIAKLVPALQFSDAEKKALVEERWRLIRQAQERNKGVPARVLEREVREAVEAVRRGQSGAVASSKATKTEACSACPPQAICRDEERITALRPVPAERFGPQN